MKKIEFNAQREMSVRSEKKTANECKKHQHLSKLFKADWMVHTNGFNPNGKYPLAKWVGVGAFNPEVNK